MARGFAQSSEVEFAYVDDLGLLLYHLPAVHDRLVRVQVVPLVDHVVFQLVPQGRGAAHRLPLLLPGLLVPSLLPEPLEAPLYDVLYGFGILLLRILLQSQSSLLLEDASDLRDRRVLLVTGVDGSAWYRSVIGRRDPADCLRLHQLLPPHGALCQPLLWQ